MSMHICMECFEHYDRRFLVKDESSPYIYYCPKTNCQGDVVELDELIAPSIIELNKKGYITKYCCSGHWYSRILSPYIYFEDYVDIPEQLPEGFVLENKNTIRKNYFGTISIDEKYNFVAKTSQDLLKWAESLETIYF